jgi:Tetratricopeptide repeat
MDPMHAPTILFPMILTPFVLVLPASARAAQGPDEEIEVRPGSRVVLTLGENDATLQGHGPSRAFGFDADFDGRLVVWARSDEVDPYLQVYRATDRKDMIGNRGGPSSLFEDDDSGGGTTACVGITVRQNEPVAITVAIRPGEAGKLELVVVAAAENDKTKQCALSMRTRLGEVQRLIAEGSFDEARTMLAAILQDGEQADELGLSIGIASATRTAAFAAAQAGAADEARRAWEDVLAHDGRVLPPDHPTALLNREEAGRALSALGDTGRARELLEGVLAVRERRLKETDDIVLRVRDALALVLEHTGELEAARNQYQRVLAARRMEHSEPHALVERARENLERVEAALKARH